MSCGGPLSAVMTIAGAGLLPGAAGITGLGSALGVASSLTNAVGAFDALNITNQFSSVVSGASSILSPGVLNSLQTLGANIFPALTNAIPGGFVSDLSVLAPGGGFGGGFTGMISDTASAIMGNGDLTKFAQVFSAAQGFVGQSNQFVNSALNIAGLATTFGPLTGGMDGLISGGFSGVTEAYGEFGSDLSQLGNLIDMKNLPNLGSPAALVSQLASVGGLVPGVETALRSAGVDTTSILNLAAGGPTNITDSANRALYQGMTQITGAELAQVKSVLGVQTPGITTMADLLNPAKILPNSYTTLTMPTPDGLRGIYATASAVNSNLERFLIDPRAPAYTGDDPVVRARLGLPPSSGYFAEPNLNI
jgi:hypothetical protein